MDIRPVRNDDDHKAALVEIEKLWGAAPDTPDGDRLDVLATLVDAYESERWPIPPVDPVDVLHFAISDMGHTRSDLIQLFGSRSRVSEVLNRKRPLTLDMIHKLSSEWHIPADALVRPYHLARTAKAKPSAKRKKRARKEAAA